jgi:glycosyltransferase involved in cell wall biosynthesis
MFPMWNEEEMIERTVGAAQAVGDELVAAGELGSYEILVVNDASTDATGKLADELAARDPRVRVVHHRVNRKLGGSVRTGLAEAGTELVLYTDADMPFDLADLHKALRLMRVYDADVVSAYRFDRTGEGVKRVVYSHAWNMMVKVFLGLRIRDVNFAFKLVKTAVLAEIELVSEGSFIDAELLAKAQRRGFSIIQFGVDYFPRARGDSTLSSPGVIVQMVRDLVELLPSIRAVRPRPARYRRSG